MKYAKLSCHPELVSGSCRSMKKEEALNKSSFRAPLRSGFTLIELLVVVLIIGILAAVAVPQYQVAVMKSRLMALVPTVKAMKQAAETYYLANGSYVNDIYAYDVEFPQCETSQLNLCKTGNLIFDIQTSNEYCGRGPVDVAVVILDGSSLETDNAVNSFGICLNHSDKPEQMYCGAATDNDRANQVCKSMGGILRKSSSCSVFRNNATSCNLYALPQ